MSVIAKREKASTQSILTSVRRFIRWVSDPKVALALIMLVLMIYLIIIPLYRMVVTTLTVQQKDLMILPGTKLGEFTFYHWSRMLFSKISSIMLYAPLRNSLVVAAGSTAIAMFLGCTMAWLVVRTDMPGRKWMNVLAIVPYMMPSWTIAMAWTVLFKN